jgi:hypothetical protein
MERFLDLQRINCEVLVNQILRKPEAGQTLDALRELGG